MKKYLKTIEDIEALRNTDTKIYDECYSGYYKFVNGVLCFYHNSGSINYGSGLWISDKPYIEVEDEPSENDIGKLGWFWDYGEDDDGFIDVLDIIDVQAVGSDKYVPKSVNCSYQHFRPLTPEEVEKYTGYKVVNNEMQANTLANNKKQAKEKIK